MAIVYDEKHQPIAFNGQAFIRLARTADRGYTVPGSSKLSPIRLGPFLILRRVGSLAYIRTGLASNSRHPYPIISIIHLEPSSSIPATRSGLTSSSRQTPQTTVLSSLDHHITTTLGLATNRLLSRASDTLVIQWWHGDIAEFCISTLCLSFSLLSRRPFLSFVRPGTQRRHLLRDGVGRFQLFSCSYVLVLICCFILCSSSWHTLGLWLQRYACSPRRGSIHMFIYRYCIQRTACHKVSS